LLERFFLRFHLRQFLVEEMNGFRFHNGNSLTHVHFQLWKELSPLFVLGGIV